jgi:SAM-dependent methyltransferase
MKCRICGNSADNSPITLHEMMYGTQEPFEYFTCGACGCLQIADIPGDLSRYYPNDYYSYTPAGESCRKPGFLSRKKFDAIFFNTGFVGKMLNRLKPEAYTQFRCFQKVSLTRRSSILDVGCGSGRDLVKMREYGFSNLMGIDPYIPESIDYGQGLTIRRMPLCDLDGTWDIIKFNHVFEHISDPVDTLRHVQRLLSPEGTCIIRVPVVPCHAFDEYGMYWMQLDAPRHLYLFSAASMELLAGNVGLRVDTGRTYHDSVSDQFWGSELYRKGIPLVDAAGKLKSYFSRRELRYFRARARQLNKSYAGDQAVFYLTHDTGAINLPDKTKIA